MSEVASATALAGRLAHVRRRIAQACAQAGRDPATVTLVGVTKMQPEQRVAELLALGVTDLGESYAQAFAGRLAQFPAARWHFIGHLQRNKVRVVVPGCVLLHSLDSERLALAVAEQAAAGGVVQEVLLELATGEETKTGVPLAELPALAERVAGLPSLRLVGLMGMAPWDSVGEEARAAFRRVRQAAERLRDRLGLPLPHLSMGMSGDLDEAVAEGATLVRVGEALCGPRQERGSSPG